MADIFKNRTVTIWNNKPSDSLMGSDAWYPTVLANTRLLETKGANIAASGISEADSARLHLYEEHLANYLDPKEWAKSSEPECYFTLCQDKDFFTVGDTSSVSIANDFYHYMKDNFDGVYQITNVDKYGLIKHFEIGGR